MKIWFTEIGEPLPFEKDVRLHRYGLLTQQLASLGHDVTWWTSTFTHAKKTFVFNSDCEREFNGVKIRLIHGPGYKKNVSIQRVKHQADFARKFIEKARAQKDLPDVIVSPVPTLETASRTIAWAREKGIPVVTDIRDEWPEEFVDLAPKPARPLMRVLLHKQFRQIRYICSHVNGIAGISGRQLNYGLKYAGRPRGSSDAILPLGYFATPVDPALMKQADEYWKSLRVRETAFIACYFGTIGPYFNLGTVVEAARVLEKEMDVQFVLCGTGSNLESVKKQAAGLESVIFPGWVDSPKISSLMRISKVGLAPYVKGARMALPNKPFEYWSGGLPILSTIEGETREIIAANDCGISYDADSVDELCAGIRALAADPARRTEMGKRARKVLESEFTTDRIARKWEDYLRRIVAAGNRKPAS